MAGVKIMTGLLSNQVKYGIFLKVSLVVLLLTVFNTSFASKYTQEFCTNCHIDEEKTPQGLKQTIHHARHGDVPADCLDCHVINPLAHKISHEVLASNEFLYKLIGTIDNVEQLEKKRLRLSKKIWMKMKENDSENCRVCHTVESMSPEFQKPKAQEQHLSAFTSGATCIDCHKGIAHNIMRDQFSEKELLELEKPNPAFIRDIPKRYLSFYRKLKEENATKVK